VSAVARPLAPPQRPSPTLQMYPLSSSPLRLLLPHTSTCRRSRFRGSQSTIAPLLACQAAHLISRPGGPLNLARISSHLRTFTTHSQAPVINTKNVSHHADDGKFPWTECKGAGRSDARSGDETQHKRQRLVPWACLAGKGPAPRCARSPATHGCRENRTGEVAGGGLIFLSKATPRTMTQRRARLRRGRGRGHERGV